MTAMLQHDCLRARVKNRVRLWLGAGMVFLLATVLTSRAELLDDWQWRNPLPQGESLRSIAYGSGRFVAVGNGGAVLTSPDGTIWTPQTFGTPQNLTAVTFANGIFVVVGINGSALTSADGQTWTPRSSGTTAYFRGIIFGNGLFVAVGHDGTILTSPDGTGWTPRSSGTALALLATTYGNGVFIAVGEGGTILTSITGTSWVRRTSGTTDELHGVTFGNGTFVAVSLSGRILTSSSGTTWTPRNSMTGLPIYAVAFGGGGFLAVGGGGFIGTSSDGVTWTNRESGTLQTLVAVAFGNGIYVTSGSMGTILTSIDRANWIPRTSGASQEITYLYSAAYGNGAFVAVGDDQQGRVIARTSTNGINWSIRYLDGMSIDSQLSVAFGSGVFVAVGGRGRITTSSDGENWLAQASPTSNWLFSVSFANNHFIAVGELGTVITSSNAVEWTSRPVPTTNELLSVTFGNGLYCAVGNNGTFLTSSDATTWAVRTLALPGELNKVAFGNGIFVGVGVRSSNVSTNLVMTSVDGANWIARESGTRNLNDIAFGNGSFVSVGALGTIISSSDGINWSIRKTGGYTLYGVAYGPGTFVTVGLAGKILQSGTLLGPPPPTFTLHPQARHARPGESITFTGIATGTLPITYQWFFNGVPLAGAINSTFVLSNVQPDSKGVYVLQASNSVGSANSQPAELSVMSEPGDGSSPTPAQVSVVTAPDAGVDSLIIITHGWQALAFGPFTQLDAGWVDGMSNIIQQKLTAQGSNNWVVFGLKWLEPYSGALTYLPGQALHNAGELGKLYGQQLRSSPWKHVHLIGHSAGSRLIQEMANAMVDRPPGSTIHTTFLDPYLGVIRSYRDVYGQNADWSDTYFSRDVTGTFTSFLNNSHNVDVTWLDSRANATIEYATVIANDGVTISSIPIGTNVSNPWSHSWPEDFYTNTIGGTLAGTMGYGFPLSLEGGGWANRGNYPTGNIPVVLNGHPPSPRLSPVPAIDYSKLTVSGDDAVPFLLSPSGTVPLGPNGFLFQTGLPPAPPMLAEGKAMPRSAMAAAASAGSPAWVSLGITVSNPVNYVKFDARFTSTNGAQGLFSVYWSTNHIGTLDERAATPGLETYTFQLPHTYTNGLQLLGFRLDNFTNAASNLLLTNVALGFIGLTNPPALNLSRNATNGLPQLTMTGAIGYTCVMQVSTNLADWRSLASFNNTNGVVQFVDVEATNEVQRFYRMVVP